MCATTPRELHLIEVIMSGAGETAWWGKVLAGNTSPTQVQPQPQNLYKKLAVLAFLQPLCSSEIGRDRTTQKPGPASPGDTSEEQKQERSCFL